MNSYSLRLLCDQRKIKYFFRKGGIIRRIALVLVWCKIIIYEREKHLVCWMDLALQGKVYYQFFPFYNPGTLEKLNFLEMLEFCSVFGFCPFSMQWSSQLLYVFHLLEDQALLRKICHHSISFLTPKPRYHQQTKILFSTVFEIIFTRRPFVNQPSW